MKIFLGFTLGVFAYLGYCDAINLLADHNLNKYCNTREACFGGDALLNMIYI